MTLLTSPPVVKVMADVLSGTLQVRLQIYGYASLIARYPTAVGKLTGTALANPATFS